MDLLYKYQESNNSVLIYPFDIAIVNRKKYVANQQDKENLWIASLNSEYKNSLSLFIPAKLFNSCKVIFIKDAVV